MNYRAILKIYTAERALTDDETAFLNTLREMGDVNRALLAEGLTDKPQKKPGKSAGKGGGSGRSSTSSSSSKSPRASGIAAQLSERRQGQRQSPTEDGSDPSDARCEFVRADGRPCKLLPDHNIHHLSSANEYHPFQSSVAPAANQSSVSGGEAGSTQSSETGKAAAGDAHHAASGGD